MKAILFFLTFLTFFDVFGQAKIRGTVIDQHGKPLEGVRITFKGQSTKSEYPNGDFEVPILGIFNPSKRKIPLTVSKQSYYLASNLGENFFVVENYNATEGITIRMTKLPLPDEKLKVAILPFCDDTPKGNPTPLITGAFTTKAAEALNHIDQENLEVIPSYQVWAAMQQYDLTK